MKFGLIRQEKVLLGVWEILFWMGTCMTLLCPCLSCNSAYNTVLLCAQLSCNCWKEDSCPMTGKDNQVKIGELGGDNGYISVEVSDAVDIDELYAVIEERRCSQAEQNNC